MPFNIQVRITMSNETAQRYESAAVEINKILTAYNAAGHKDENGNKYDTDYSGLNIMAHLLETGSGVDDMIDRIKGQAIRDGICGCDA